MRQNSPFFSVNYTRTFHRMTSLLPILNTQDTAITSQTTELIKQDPT